MNQDEEHLRLLSIFHYIVAGIVALFSLFGAFYLIMGVMMVTIPGHFGEGAPPPLFVGWMFIVLGAGFILCGITLAILILITGLSLHRKRHYTFCMVIAAIECLFMPYGTVLGIFTLIVLLRDSVKALFHPQAGVQPLA